MRRIAVVLLVALGLSLLPGCPFFTRRGVAGEGGGEPAAAGAAD